jgi:hypothetical protein
LVYIEKTISRARANETRKLTCGYIVKTSEGKEDYLTPVRKIPRNVEIIRFRFYVKAGERNNKYPGFRLTAWFRIVKE